MSTPSTPLTDDMIAERDRFLRQSVTAAISPSGESGFKVEVEAFGLTEAEADALFDRVSEAAHALDQQVTCSAQFRARLRGESS